MLISPSSATMTVEAMPSGWAIAAIAQPIIERYFATLNAGSFSETADLFGEAGELHPPFTEPVVGKEAIAAYLEDEAYGMTFYPQTGITQILTSDQTQVEIVGRVQTRWFSINARWQFLLDSQPQILSAVIELLASAPELMQMRSR